MLTLLARSEEDATTSTLEGAGRTLLTRHASTSYCRYGTLYQKDTSFLTTMTDIRLASTCTARSACAQSRASGGRHVAEVQGLPSAAKNAVPSGLLNHFLDVWFAKHSHAPTRRFLVLDVFSGYGSVADACKLRATKCERRLSVVTNDIRGDTSQRAANFSFDMRFTPIDVVLRLALLVTYSEIGTSVHDTGNVAGGSSSGEKVEQGKAGEDTLSLLRRHDVAVLLWISTPCETYSTAGAGTHRAAGSVSPKSQLAIDHDAMNLALVTDLQALALQRP